MATVYDQTKDAYFQGGEGTINRSSSPLVASDTVDFAAYPKNIMLLTAGTISVLPLKNIDGVFVATGSLLAGSVLPFRARRINATGTTATFVGLND
jgi:hypothetical protein